MHEHQLQVERTARYYTLGSAGAQVRRLWVVLHGYGQLAASLLRRCEPLTAPDTLVVAPEALSRFYVTPVSPADHGDARVGASWMTREARASEIADYVGYLDRLHAELTRVCGGSELELRVLGFSQGVATAVRWALLGTAAPPRQLVLWAGHLPPETWTDAARARFADTEIVLAAGDTDPYIAPGDLEKGVERAQGFGYCVRGFSFVGGHAITPAVLQQALQPGDRAARESAG
jgi:predicted esterase